MEMVKINACMWLATWRLESRRDIQIVKQEFPCVCQIEAVLNNKTLIALLEISSPSMQRTRRNRASPILVGYIYIYITCESKEDIHITADFLPV
jgi:hypothetical protein